MDGNEDLEMPGHFCEKVLYFLSLVVNISRTYLQSGTERYDLYNSYHHHLIIVCLERNQ